MFISLDIFLTILFSIVCIISSIMVITSYNPVYSVLFLILSFCSASAYLIVLDVEFLALIFLIVYVGAIAILFLFIVMMLNIRILDLKESLIKYLPLGTMVGFILLIEIFLVLQKIFITTNIEKESIFDIHYVDWANIIETNNSIESLGNVIYTFYVLAFMLAGIILLVSMIGSIILTLSHKNNVRRQDLYLQMSRTLDQSYSLKKLRKKIN